MGRGSFHIRVGEPTSAIRDAFPMSPMFSICFRMVSHVFPLLSHVSNVFNVVLRFPVFICFPIHFGGGGPDRTQGRFGG